MPQATVSKPDVHIMHKYMLSLRVNLYDFLHISLVSFPIRKGWVIKRSHCTKRPHGGGSIKELSEGHLCGRRTGRCCHSPNKHFLEDMCWVLCQKVGTHSETQRHSLGLQPLKGCWLPMTPINPRPALLSFLHIVVKGKISSYNLA